MDQIIRFGMDTSKRVFQRYGVDASQQPVRAGGCAWRGRVLAFFAGLSPLKVGMEACGTAHYWTGRGR